MPRPNKPVTIREIAKSTGLSTATVSMALRDNPKISLAVRQRVREVAQQAGYRPNPLMAAHWQSVRTRKFSGYQSTIAVLNDHESIKSWDQSEWGRETFRAFKARANELGYLAEEFHVGRFNDADRRKSLAQVVKIMRARGISAYMIMFCAHPRIFLESATHLSEFAGVFINSQFSVTPHQSAEGPIHLPFHRVNPDRYGNMLLLLDKLRSMGYRRPGYWPSHWMEGITAGESSAAFTFRIRDLGSAYRIAIPAKGWRLDLPIQTHKTAFLKWLVRSKPDVVICENFEIRQWILEAGLRIPQEVGLAHLSLGPMENDWSGIDPHPERIASSAADLLTSHLQRNERGTPTFSKEIRIDGSWVVGTSCCNQHSKAGPVSPTKSK